MLEMFIVLYLVGCLFALGIDSMYNNQQAIHKIVIFILLSWVSVGMTIGEIAINISKISYNQKGGGKK